MHRSQGTLSSIKRAMRLIRPYRGALIRMLLAGLAVTVLSLPLPLLTKVLVDSVYPNADANLLVIVILGITALRFGGRWLSSITGLFSRLVSLRMERNVHLRFMTHVHTLSTSFLKNRQVGEVVSRLSDARLTVQGTANLLSELFSITAMLLFFPPVLFWLHWKLALLAIALLPLSSLIVAFANRVIRRITEQSAAALAGLNALEVESLSGFQTVKTFGLENFVLERIQRALAGAIDAMHRRALWEFGAGLANSTVTITGTVLFTYYGWRCILGGSLSLGSFLAFSSLVGYIRSPLNQLLQLTQKLQTTLVHTDRFFEIIDTKPGIKTGSVKLPADLYRPNLVLDCVSFEYPESPMVLDNISLSIQAGEIIIVTGPSGSGKTTLLSLMARQLTPTSGRILLNGIEMTRLHSETLQSQIVMLPQEPFLFEGTVAENILCGFEAGEVEVIRVAELAGAHDFIKDLPLTYDTPVGERGERLSVGQKQRICLARFLLRNPAIWLLDEPSSAWDLEMERRVWQNLLNPQRNRTVVLASHRSSLISFADWILELHRGGNFSLKRPSLHSFKHEKHGRA